MARAGRLVRPGIALFAAALIAWTASMSAFAGTTGKISGTVKDEESGEFLVSATIVLKGTKTGTTTNIEGFFFLTNIEPGAYKLNVSLVGYTPVSVENVRVLIDQTTTVNVRLKSSAVDLPPVVVVAERPLIEPKVTNKSVSISSDDIRSLPITGTQDILNMQAGVVQVEGRFNKIPGFEDRGIDQTHVRGGRNGEIAYMVDGMYVEDAIYAGMGTFINRGAVEEMKIEVGGFSAEYGEAQSGVVNIVTKEGGAAFSGSLEASTSGWADLDGEGGYEPISERDALRDYHNVLATLSAPIPGIPDVSLFASAEQMYSRYAVYQFDNIVYDPTPITDPTNPHYGENVGDTAMTFAYGKERLAHPYDTFTGWHSHGFNKSWDVSGKLTIRMSPVMKVNALVRVTERTFRPYAFAWTYAENAQNIVTDQTDQQGITLRHQVSPSTFYTVNLNRFWKVRDYLIPGLAGDVLGPGLHTQDLDHDGVGAPEDPDELWHYDPSSPDYPNQSFTGAYADPLTIIGYDSIRGVYLYDGGATQYWTRNYQQSFGAKVDITSQVNPANELKAGLEYRMLDIYFRELQYPWLDNPYSENYLYHPKEASAYLQDQVDLGRLIVNIGGRVDYALSGGTGWSNPKDPTSPIEKATYKLQFSPRLGFGYRIAEATTFHFNYGHFFQIPEYRNLYAGSTLDLTTPNPLFGNPLLQAQKTIGYEFGARQQLGDMWAVDVTAWTKSLTGQAGSINIMGFDPDSLGAYSYYVFDNYDYGSARGVDLTVEKRFSENYGGSLNYTYSVAKANRYYSWTGYWNGETDETEPKREMLMQYDQTHKLYAIMYFRLGEQFGPETFGFWLFENWFFNFVFNYQSGYPYTPVVGSRAEEPMSARSPARFQIDMTVRKEFRVFGSSTLGIFARIYNLLDKKNILYVYPATGSATEPDPTAGGYSTQYDRPDFYDTRRQIDLGVRIDF
jgi:hypothetical protein